MKKNLVYWVVALAALAIGVEYYRGWLAMERNRTIPKASKFVLRVSREGPKIPPHKALSDNPTKDCVGWESKAFVYYAVIETGRTWAYADCNHDGEWDLLAVDGGAATIYALTTASKDPIKFVLKGSEAWKRHERQYRLFIETYKQQITAEQISPPAKKPTPTLGGKQREEFPPGGPW